MNDREFFLQKKKKRHYDCERYRNLPEYEKQRLVEYRKNYSKMQKVNNNWLILSLIITENCITK